MAFEEYSSHLSMPRQKLPSSKKNEEWQKACIDAALSISGLYNNNRRTSKFKKKVNYDLYNGRLNKRDLEHVVNPLGVTGVEFPASIQPYDVWSPIFNLLFGEEGKRGINFVVKVVNEEAITEKEEAKKQEILAYLQQILAQSVKDPSQPLPQLEHASFMNYQDMRESMSSKILSYLRRDLNLDIIFQKGWEDALLAGEEIYAVEDIAGNPSARRVNPLELSCVLPHNSDFIDDAEIIVEDTFMSFSQLIDTFYDRLSDEQIEQLEQMSNGSASGQYNNIEEVQFIQGDDYYNSYNATGIFDSRGNVRIAKITWKSKRRIGELSFLDPSGNQQVTIVDETFKVDKSSPDESIKWMWVNQYWEGYKIGNELYFGTQPKKMQFRRLDNLSECKSGYIGTIYNANNSQSVSLMDRLIPWIYLFISIAYNTELAMATNIGKIALIDTALIPSDWDVEKWMYYAKTLKFGFVNSFNEGNKGAATGKLAGPVSNQNKVLDLETGAYIQQHVQLLEFIETKIEELSGVTRQRKGQITTTDGLGTSQQAITQSSHITEKWFQIHNWTKQRVLESLLEVAKHCWKNKPSKKLQYFMDDLSITMLTVDTEAFCEADYGVFVSNSTKDLQALEMMKQLTQAAMQNDRLDLSDVATLFMSESLSEIRSKLKESEANRGKQQQAADEANRRHEQELFDKQQQMESFKQDREDQRADKANDTKIRVAEIGAMSFEKDQDMNDNAIPDVLEIEKLRHNVRQEEEKIAVQREKIQADKDKTDKQLKANARSEQLKAKLKERELSIKKIVAKKPNKKK